MTADTLAAAIRPTILAALQAEFADEIGTDADTFSGQVGRLSQALASGIATGLVPYLQSPATVVTVPGQPPGRLV